MNSGMSQDTGMDQLRLSQIVRALGQPLVMIPLSSVATAGIEKEQAGSSSSLFNMMRNLGGSIGIAALATILFQREKFHSNRLGESISMFSTAIQERLEQMTQFFLGRGFAPEIAHNQAIASIDAIVRREAYIMAYNDCFYFIGCALLLSGLTVIFLKKAQIAPGGGGH